MMKKNIKGFSEKTEKRYGFGPGYHLIYLYKNKHMDVISVSEDNDTKQKIIRVFSGRYENTKGVIDVPLELSPHFGIFFECYWEMRSILKSKYAKRLFTKLISSLTISGNKMEEFMNGGYIEWDKTWDFRDEKR